MISALIRLPNSSGNDTAAKTTISRLKIHVLIMLYAPVAGVLKFNISIHNLNARDFLAVTCQTFRDRTMLQGYSNVRNADNDRRIWPWLPMSGTRRELPSPAKRRVGSL